MNRNALNLGLVVVAAGLGAAVFFSRKKPENLPPLTPYTKATLNSVVIDHPGAPEIKLEKKSGVWKLLTPVLADTDSFEMNAFPDLATLKVKSSYTPAQVNLKDLGLDPPAYSVTLNGQKIEFGGVAPINYHRYVLTNGKVDLIPDPPAEALDSNYSDLVSKLLIPPGEKIESIALPGQTIARSADDKSWVLTPDRPEIGSDARQKLVDAWAGAAAMWNAAEPKEGSKGDVITVSFKNHTPVRFVVVSRRPELVIARPDLGVRYTLSEQMVDTMLQLQAPVPAAAVKTGANDETLGKSAAPAAPALKE
ncbi:MAG: DUF4340 domain-containing protein [Stenotrophobium sp.]